MMSLGRYKQAGSIGKYVQFASDIFSHTGCAHDGAVPRVDVGEPTLKKLTYQISPQSHAFGTVARGAIDSMSGVFGTGPVAELVGIEGGVVSGVFNLEAPDRRPRHEEHYHEA